MARAAGTWKKIVSFREIFALFVLIAAFFVLMLAIGHLQGAAPQTTAQCGDVVLEGYIVTDCPWQMYPQLPDGEKAYKGCALDTWLAESPDLPHAACSDQPLTSSCFLAKIGWEAQPPDEYPKEKVVITGGYEKIRVCGLTSKEPFPEECNGKYEIAKNPAVCTECKEESVLVPCEIKRALSLDEEKAIKEAVLANIREKENTQNAKIAFPKIGVSGSSADVDIVLHWDPDACVGYHYKLQKDAPGWRVESRVMNLIC